MDGNDFGHATYLVLLGLFIGGGVLFSYRGQLGAMAKQASAWALIFAAVIVGYGLFNDNRTPLIRAAVTAQEGRIEIPRAADGHYHVTLRVNGAAIPFIVDTGASHVVLSLGDARRAGLNPDELAYTGRAYTANGAVETAPVRLDEVELGGLRDRNIRATVNSGQMDGSLLGMSYLNSFDRIEINDGMLILERG